MSVFIYYFVWDNHINPIIVGRIQNVPYFETSPERNNKICCSHTVQCTMYDVLYTTDIVINRYWNSVTAKNNCKMELQADKNSYWVNHFTVNFVSINCELLPNNGRKFWKCVLPSNEVGVSISRWSLSIYLLVVWIEHLKNKCIAFD